MALALLVAAPLPALAQSMQFSSGGGSVTSLAQLPTINNNTLLGNNSGSSSTPSALTAAQSKTLLAIANTDVSGLGTAATAATGTSGHTLPFLDGVNTFSGAVSGTSFTGSGVGTFAGVASSNDTWLRADGQTQLHSSSGVLFLHSWGSGNFVFDNSNNTVQNVTIDNSGNVVAQGSFTATTGYKAGATTILNSSGVLQAAGFPALTGDVTTSAGALGTTIANSAVTTAKMANLAGVSLLANPTGSAAAPSAVTLAGGLGFSGTTLTAAGALTPTSVASSGTISGTAITGSSLAVTGVVTSSGATSGIGYATGAGGAVTQITSRTTGVTNNKACGAITMFSAAGSATWATFTVTDSAVAATDTIIANEKSGTNLYMLAVTAVGAGTFNLSFATTGGTATDAPVINYCVIKGVAA
jgi:hypothetical protein